MKSPKPVNAWGIVSPMGTLAPYTVYRRKVALSERLSSKETVVKVVVIPDDQLLKNIWAVTFDGEIVADACFTEKCAADLWAKEYKGSTMRIDVIPVQWFATPIPPKRKGRRK